MQMLCRPVYRLRSWPQSISGLIDPKPSARRRRRPWPSLLAQPVRRAPPRVRSRREAGCPVAQLPIPRGAPRAIPTAIGAGALKRGARRARRGIVHIVLWRLCEMRVHDWRFVEEHRLRGGAKRARPHFLQQKALQAHACVLQNPRASSRAGCRRPHDTAGETALWAVEDYMRIVADSIFSLASRGRAVKAQRCHLQRQQWCERDPQPRKRKGEWIGSDKQYYLCRSC